MNPEDLALNQAIDRLANGDFKKQPTHSTAVRSETLAPIVQQMAEKHKVVRIDGGDGMSSDSAQRLLESVGDKLATLPSYNQIKGVKT